MTDIEIFKAALNSSIRTITSNLGLPYLAPIVTYGINNILTKPKNKLFMDALTDGNGNIDIDALSKAFKDTLQLMPNKPTLLGVSFGPEDIDLFTREFLSIKNHA